MPRKKLQRFLQYIPSVTYFKPQGIPLRILQTIELHADELEALKLYEVDALDQQSSANIMKISQPTFARILSSAQKKIATAIVRGHAIQIETNQEVNTAE